MTRYRQFQERQRKYANRRRHLSGHNRDRKPKFPGTHGGGKRWEFVGDGPQLGPRVRPSAYVWDRFPVTPPPYAAATFTGGGWGNPPHVKVTDAEYLARVASGDHSQTPVVGMHSRRVKYTGRKIGRMNGAQRRIMGATWHACVNGYFPAWDPLSRSPTAQEVADGAEPFPDWRWGVTGDYPPP